MRSESSPHLREALSNSFFPAKSSSQGDYQDHNASLEPPRRGPQSLGIGALTQPTFTHQSDFAFSRRAELELPPLLTRFDDWELCTTNRYHQAELHELADAPEQSPANLKRTSIPVLTGDKIERHKKESQNRVLSGWFHGESEAINIGIVPSPTKEKSDPLSDMSTKPTSSATKPTLSTRFSLFGSKASPPKNSSSPADPSDEFLDLDINAALQPNGPPDTFSPASFKNHMQHAEGLLSRLQAAYKERTIALQDMTAEKETQAEEFESTETRSKHLKIQLDDMAAKLAEQDKAMMDLVEELANEKRLRREEEDARKRSIKLVKPSGVNPLTFSREDDGCKSSRRRQRLSSGTETDCDSEEESSAESLFSRNNLSSARISLSSVSTTSSPESYQQPDFSGVATAQTARLRHSQSILIKTNRPPSSGGESLFGSCANCQGANSSEAWSVVNVLREENHALKERVSHMESAIDGCLDMVGSLH